MQTFTSMTSKLPVIFYSYAGGGSGTAQHGLKAVTDPACVIDEILCTNADVAVAKITIYCYIAGTYYPVGAAIVPIGAGMAGAPSFDALANAMPADFGSLAIPGPYGLSWALDANLTSGQLTVMALGGSI